MDIIFIMYLSQLIGMSPILIVYLIGMILAVVFWQRCPRASLFTLLAMMLLLLTALVQSFLVLYLSRARDVYSWNSQTFSWIMASLSIIGSVLRAGGLGLLLAAVFSGRRAAHTVSPDQPRHLGRPESRPTDEHGIVRRPGS